MGGEVEFLHVALLILDDGRKTNFQDFAVDVNILARVQDPVKKYIPGRVTVRASRYFP